MAENPRSETPCEAALARARRINGELNEELGRVKAARKSQEWQIVGLRQALSVIGDGDVPGVDFAPDDLISEFALAALAIGEIQA